VRENRTHGSQGEDGQSRSRSFRWKFQADASICTRSVYLKTKIQSTLTRTPVEISSRMIRLWLFCIFCSCPFAQLVYLLLTVTPGSSLIRSSNFFIRNESVDKSRLKQPAISDSFIHPTYAAIARRRLASWPRSLSKVPLIFAPKCRSVSSTALSIVRLTIVVSSTLFSLLFYLLDDFVIS
jgi:hypothetical protein